MGLFSRSKQSTSSNEKKVIALINQKGGVGKTTMAFNLAHALKAKGKEVLCIDMDPQGNLTHLFGINPYEVEYNIFHLLINSVRELKAIHSSVIPSDVISDVGGIDVIPAGQDLSGFELSVAGISSPRQLVLRRFLEKNHLYGQYDYIIFDCPPTLGLLVVNILCATDGVFVPFRPDEFSKLGLNHFNEVLADIEDMGVVATPEILAHVPNLVDPRRKQEELDLAKIYQDISGGDDEDDKRPVLPPILNRAQLVKSQAQKKSVFDYGSKEYAHLQDHFSKMAEIVTNWSH